MTLLRPEWLLILPLIIWFLWKQRSAGEARWQSHIDPDLLRPLLRQQQDRYGHWFRRAAAGSLVLMPLALAGPAIERPASDAIAERPMVIILDQSLSMLSEDTAPTRHVRAQQKIQDWMRANPERPTALVAYSGTAHVVAPITFDHDALNTMLLQLSPLIMPMPGSNPALAMEMALDQLDGRRGDILWFTDDLTPEQRVSLPDLTHSDQQLGIITLGTPEGAPVRLDDGTYLRDRAGDLVEPGLDPGEIQILANDSQVQWQQLTLDDSDWQRVLGDGATMTSADTGEPITITRDLGPWLLLLLLPGLLIFFRRGHLLGFGLAAVLVAQPSPVQASPADWFRSPDQQGAARLPDDPEAALPLFRSSSWQAYVALETERHELALNLLADAESPLDLYHRANARVFLEQYEEALADYDLALAQDPDFAEARQNRDLVARFLEQPPPDDSEDEQAPPDGGPSGDSQTRSDGPMSTGQTDESAAGAPSTQAEDSEAQAMEDSIRRRLPDPDATFLQRKFQYQYDSEPERYDDTGPAW